LTEKSARLAAANLIDRLSSLDCAPSSGQVPAGFAAVGEGNLMSRLFTYTIPMDDGAAPNPFHGMCSLAICKPSIRRVAREGDWVGGLGSRNAPSGDLGGRLVYAMLVQEVVTL
jgi:Nucleotide modification associated domain 2